MRYEKGHKAETRQRVIEVAARRFRRDGIGGTGVAGLMADAGLTHGGFYAHFPSKEELVRDAVAGALATTRGYLAAAARAARERGQDGMEALVRAYLSPGHRDRPEEGCAYAALSAELARHPDETREVLTRELRESLALIAGELPASLPPDRTESMASAILGVMMGSLQLARATSDPALSDSLLESGRAAALALARQGGP